MASQKSSSSATKNKMSKEKVPKTSEVTSLIDVVKNINTMKYKSFFTKLEDLEPYELYRILSLELCYGKDGPQIKLEIKSTKGDDFVVYTNKEWTERLTPSISILNENIQKRDEWIFLIFKGIDTSRKYKRIILEIQYDHALKTEYENKYNESLGNPDLYKDQDKNEVFDDDEK